jgi:hypothetical protein
MRTPMTHLDRQVQLEKLKGKGTRNIIINWDGREYRIGPENEVKKNGSPQARYNNQNAPLQKRYLSDDIKYYQQKGN